MVSVSRLPKHPAKHEVCLLVFLVSYSVLSRKLQPSQQCQRKSHHVATSEVVVSKVSFFSPPNFMIQSD